MGFKVLPMSSEKRKIAVVTGASSGIGAEIARHLKNETDLEIWLVARRQDRLDAMAKELEESGAHTRCLSLDLQDPKSWKQLEDEVASSGSTVAWLVNNAGFGYSGLFENESLESIEGMTSLNVTALSSITRRLLPYMRAGSHIVNLASSISFIPAAGYAVYAGTKAFVLAFSLSLRAELKERGISVSAVCPGPVATEFFDLASMDAPPKFLMENPKNTAFLTVEKSTQGKAIIITGFASWSLRLIGALLPRSWIAALSRKVLKGPKFQRKVSA